jgi:gamma-glutamyl-gamma-aminobutyrate hydrolase PuuD
MNRVALSQRVAVDPASGERRDAVDQQLVRFIAAAGGRAFPLPNALDAPEAVAAWLHALSPEAVVLSGGDDIGACPERDLTESALLTYARARRLPVLGICRGMQMLAHWSGGSGLNAVAGHVRTRHRLTGTITGEVNSFHAYALRACPAGFSVLATSDDGEIEAIRHQSLPWEGWMWHPEREPAGFVPRDLQRLKVLLHA